MTQIYDSVDFELWLRLVTQNYDSDWWLRIMTQTYDSTNKSDFGGARELISILLRGDSGEVTT